MTPLPDFQTTLSPSAYLVDEFEYLWRTGKIAIACELIEKNFHILPDPSPLRLAIAELLARHSRQEDAEKLLETTILHLLHSGFFFRAVAAFVDYRRIGRDDHGLAKQFYNLYGPASEYTRYARGIPPFPEPDPAKILRTAMIVKDHEKQETSRVQPTLEQALDRLWNTARDPYGVKLTPGFVSKLPIFSKFQEQTFYQFLQLIDVQKYESTQLVDDLEQGELVWIVGQECYLRTKEGLQLQLDSGTILGLDHFYPSSGVKFEIIANRGALLRLPPVTLEVIKSSWENFREDLTVLAFSSLLEQRLVSHPLFASIPTEAYTKFVEQLEIRVVEQGNIIGVSNTENHLGSNSSASSFFLVLAGNVAVSILQDDADAALPKSCTLQGPCVVGAFDFFLEGLPTMIFRSKSNLVLVELTASKIQELIVAHPRVGVELRSAAERVLAQLLAG